MTSINPLDVLLWTLRRNEKDVINLYSTMSPMMQTATGGEMLNFGYWDDDHNTPITAQENLCNYFGIVSELENAKNVIDVGSGLSAPAKYWKKQYDNLSIYCVNINYSQLHSGKSSNHNSFNSSSTMMPFSSKSVDRILALESSQHFKPYSDFLSESKRILSEDGLLVLAVPITINSPSANKLGILKFTWSSEHYSLKQIHEFLNDAGFSISEEKLIGPSVYDPLADYYVANRDRLQKLIIKEYSPMIEKILFKSIQKMKQASESRIIDYVLLKCHL
ncbi:methyltransferase domain-containing protein [Nitrosopumilus sp.]|uniref:methyltransferase domain-containing protein n=1 Tax=Nitrosopumilus sp. TaxID=2024843 RepID=UPI002614E1F0|nr:methyltransferase domain-containing protein [Nitrosopumilus sp.]